MKPCPCELRTRDVPLIHQGDRRVRHVARAFGICLELGRSRAQHTPSKVIVQMHCLRCQRADRTGRDAIVHTIGV